MALEAMKQRLVDGQKFRDSYVERLPDAVDKPEAGGFSFVRNPFRKALVALDDFLASRKTLQERDMTEAEAEREARKALNAEIEKWMRQPQNRGRRMDESEKARR